MACRTTRDTPAPFIHAHQPETDERQEKEVEVDNDEVVRYSIVRGV